MTAESPLGYPLNPINKIFPSSPTPPPPFWNRILVHFIHILRNKRLLLKPYFFYIILNMAVGGNLPGSPNTETAFPQTMLVDYIRIYQ